MTAIILRMEPSRSGRALARAASNLGAIGLRLVAARTAKQLTPTEVCALTGLATNQLSNWEGGHSRPRVDQLALLLPLYDVTSDFVYFGDDRALAYQTREAITDVLEGMQAPEAAAPRRRGRPPKSSAAAVPDEITDNLKKQVV